MSAGVLKDLFYRVNEYLENRTDDSVELLWHGGEPLMAGSDFFASVSELQGELCSGTADRISHGIQSNLTLFSEKYIGVFKKLKITKIGTSFDPEPGIRGPGRKINTELYNKKFIESLSLLERHGFEWGAIYIVTRKSLVRPLDIFFFLTNLKLSGMISINPVLIDNGEKSDISITPNEYVEFLGAIFPTWWKYRRRYPHIEPFGELTELIVNRKIAIEEKEVGETIKNIVIINHDGESLQSGRPSDKGVISYGNIGENRLDDIFRTNKDYVLGDRAYKRRVNDCQSCRIMKVCVNNCEMDAFAQNDKFMEKSEWCEARKDFVEKYVEPVTGVMIDG